MNIHLWKLNSSICKAWVSSMTFKAARIKLTFLFFLFSFELKIWMSTEINPGQTVLNIFINEDCESLINNIRMQNSIKISKAGEDSSYFIT
jgi:hypothetical protein